MAILKASSPITDLYPTVWKSCLKLWPLFLVQLAFLFLEYAVLWVLLLVLFGPFFRDNWQALAEGFKDPNNFDWGPLTNAAANYFTDFNWILTAFLAAVLYTLWWSVLSAFADGGIYRAFWAHFEKGESFSFKGFFKGGAAYLLQMLFYQTLFLTLYLIFTIGFMVFASLGALLAGFLFSYSKAAGFLLMFFGGVPTVFAAVFLFIALAAYAFLWKAEITREKNAGTGMGQAFKVAWDSLWESARKFRENRWRTGLGLVVAFLVYIVVTVILRFFFGVLGIIPFIGLFFSLMDFLAATALVILFMTYMPALSVCYLLEEAD